MTYIEMAWYGFWTGAGSSLAWALAARPFPHHTSAARLIGAIIGLAAAHVLPRLLVYHLIELPRSRQDAAASSVPVMATDTLPLLPIPKT